jgi:splicing factor 3B subunit 1
MAPGPIANLDQILPTEGYLIVTPPKDYNPVRTRKLVPASSVPEYGFMQQDDSAASAAVAAAGGYAFAEPTEIEGVGNLAFFKQEDAKVA